MTTRSTGVNLARRQIADAWGAVYVFDKPFKQARRFRAAQRSARSTGLGVWGVCGGDFHRSADNAEASAMAIAAARRFRGFVDRLAGEPTHEGSQGAGWRAVFSENVSGRVRYRVCLRHLGNGEQRCWNRRVAGPDVAALLLRGTCERFRSGARDAMPRHAVVRAGAGPAPAFRKEQAWPHTTCMRELARQTTKATLIRLPYASCERVAQRLLARPRRR